MRRQIVVVLTASILLLSLMGTGNVWAKDIEEKVTVTQGRMITSSEERAISSAALKVLRHIAQARADIREKNINHAKEELRQSLVLVDIIKASLPTAEVKDRIWLAKKHLSYEDTGTVKKDLIPIYASLDEIEDIVPVEKVRENINKARTYLENGNKTGAIEELNLADQSLLYSEIDLPLANTERHIRDAQGFLSTDNVKKAEEALEKAEDGVQFISINMYSPVSQAKKSLWLATKDYISGDLTAAKRDLNEAKYYLDRAVKRGDAKKMPEAEKLMKDIESVEGKVDKGAKETGQDIKNLYEGVKALTLKAVNVFQAGGNQEGEDIGEATQNLNLSK